MNQNFESTAENFAADLQNGLHSILYKRIKTVNINDSRIRDAFTRFQNEVECGKNGISVADVIYSAESVVKDATVDENAENEIYVFDNLPDDNKLSKKLLKHSVGGIYSLLSLNNGILLDTDALGGNISAAEVKRFLVIPSKKAKKIVSFAEKNGIKPIRVGQILSTNKIHLSHGNNIYSTLDKSLLSDSPENCSVTLSADHFKDFLSGYHAVCSLVLCDCISSNNIIRFGLTDDLSSVFARALGYFSALLYLGHLPVRTVFSAENNASLAVSRPNVSDGDYMYLLRLHKDANGLPDKNHMNQLLYYLKEKKRMGIIKDVLPVRENIDRLINRLSRNDLEYVQFSLVPENSFGVIVSVGRGESVNGIKLGYFKDI